MRGEARQSAEAARVHRRRESWRWLLNLRRNRRVSLRDIVDEAKRRRFVLMGGAK